MSVSALLCNARSVSALLLALSIALSGCGDDKKGGRDDSNGDGAVDQVGVTEDKSPYLPFTIAFRKDGTPVILDEKGNEDASWKPVEFPLRTNALYKVETITFTFTEGSCIITAYNVGDSGLAIGKKYPDFICKNLGIK